MIKKRIVYLLFVTLLAGCNNSPQRSEIGEVENIIEDSIENSLLDYIHLNTIYCTDLVFTGGRRYLPFSIFNDTAYVFSKIDKDCLCFNAIDLNSTKTSILKYPVKQCIIDSLKYRNRSFDIEVSSEYIYMLYGNFLVIINRYMEDANTIYNLDNDFLNLKKVGDYLYLSSVHNFSGKLNYEAALVAKYSLEKHSVVEKKVLDFDASEYSYYQPNHWIDISSRGNILFSHTLSANHFVFDSSLSIVQSLTHKPANWEDVNTDKNNQIRKYHSDTLTENSCIDVGYILKHLSQQTKGDGCRVVSNYLVSDSIFIIYYTAPTKEEKADHVRYCNIYKYEQNQWVLSKEQLIDGNLSSNTIFNGSNYPFNGSYTYLKSYKGKLFYISIFPDNKKLLEVGKTWKDIERNIENAVKTDDLMYHLFEYGISL